jgi:2'-5' RNA ligase
VGAGEAEREGERERARRSGSGERGRDRERGRERARDCGERERDCGERARLFVALELPAAIAEALAAWGAEAAGRSAGALRALGAEALHVTLCFLGWRAVQELPAIVGALEPVVGGVGGGAPALALGEPRWLPSRRPGVLAVALEDEGGRLAILQARVSQALSALGVYAPERRPFLAHVTVARVRRGARVGRHALPALALPGPWRGERVTLFRSHPGPAGSRYEALWSRTLGLELG